MYQSVVEYLSLFLRVIPMPNFMDISPGLMLWTLLNFGLFFILLAKFAWKPIVESLSAREKGIDDAITRAEQANIEAQKILKENEEKLAKAQQEMMQLIRDGRAQADAQVQAAMQDAENVKKQKLEEARVEIQRAKDHAMQELKKEVSALVVMATEKILKEKLDQQQQKKMIDSFIADIPTN